MKKLALLTLLSTLPYSNEFFNTNKYSRKKSVLQPTTPLKASFNKQQQELLKRQKTNAVFESQCEPLKKLILEKPIFWNKLDYHQMDVTHKAFETACEPLKQFITKNIYRWHTLDTHTMFMIKDAYTSGRKMDIRWKDGYTLER